MRDCANGDMRDLLPDWVHGRLDADRARLVAAHVADCGDCAEEVALLRDLASSLTAATPAVNVAAIVAALPKPPKARPRVIELRWYQRTQMRAAAVLLFMAGATSYAVLSRAPSTAGDLPIPAAIGFAGGVSDLSEGDLQSLLKEMDKLDATPAAEPEGNSTIPADLGEVSE
jgi:hypothetical protein